MSDSKPRRLASLIRILVTFIVAFDLAFVGQKLAGAYSSEFGAHPDEAAHCVTGIFVHDAIRDSVEYARSGFEGSPVERARGFAKEFYAHYPKVAMGVWPPAFHATQALWMFPFGVSRLSLLLLMAALAASVATLIFEVLYRQHGWWAATIGTLIWLCGPLVRELTSLVMAEMLSALAMFSATLFWGKYLEHARAKHAVWFAVFASLAIMTKGTGIALLLMCAISILLARKWGILARPSLWAAALIVVVLAGIWTWTFRHEGTRVGGWEAETVQWAFTSKAAVFYARTLAFSLAVAVLIFALIGFATAWRQSPATVALGSLVIAVLVFQSVIPAGREERHLLSATPALVVLAVTGAFALARHASLRVADVALQRRREHLWILLLALLALPQALLASRSKSYEGFGPMAEEVLNIAPAGARILVCSDASGEGMFISELAMRDERPNLIVERASKTLVDPQARDWAGKNLRERFTDDAALLTYILRSKIAYVVLDAAIPEDKRAGYHDQLRRLIADQTGTFWPVAECPIRRKGEDLFPPLRLYRITRDLLPGVLPQTPR